jgi:hypothetical protein
MRSDNSRDACDADQQDKDDYALHELFSGIKGVKLLFS